MGAHGHAVGVDDAAFVLGQVAREELGEPALADEADTGAVLLVVDGQAGFPGDAPHVSLEHSTEGKQAVLELIDGHGLQEIALVLVVVHAFQQLELAVGMACTHIVARRDHVGAQQARVIEKEIELDLPVAEHVGIRRASRGVLVEKAGEDIVPVLRCEIRFVQRDPEVRAHGSRVVAIDLRSAIFLVVVLVPVLHEHALDAVSPA